MNENKIIKIGAKELSNYIEKIYYSEIVKRIIVNAPSISSGNGHYIKLGHILTSYAIATGDLSDESIEIIAKSYEEHLEYFRYRTDNNDFNKPIKLTPLQRFFNDFVMPKMILIWMKRLSISSPLKISDVIKINDNIYKQCKNNFFYTHSFSGALYDQINCEGLDISHEKFQKEYDVLSYLNDSPFKKGKLCICELSEASFGYALGCPERFGMIVKNPSTNQEKNETNLEYFMRNVRIRANTLKDELTAEQYEAVIAAGDKIANFYYSQDKACIALIPDERKNVDTSSPYITNFFFNSFSALKFPLYKIFKKDEEMAEKYNVIVNAIRAKDTDVCNKVQLFMDEFLRRYPDNILMANITQEAMCSTITTMCLNNFMHNGNADGYEVPTGRLDRNNFEIAVIKNPSDLITEYNKGKSL